VDWLRNLRIVLIQERVSYVLDSPKLASPAENATEEEKATYQKWQDDSTLVQCIMLASMSNELQRQHEKMDAKAILVHLKDLYGEQSRTARYEISKQLFQARMTNDISAEAHVLKLINLIEELGKLGFTMDGELCQDLILQSLPESFSQFIINFHMNKLDVSLPELLNMLKTAETHLVKDKGKVMLVEGASKKKAKKGPKKGKPSDKFVKPKKQIKKEKGKEKISEKGTCFHCGKDGHWKRNCKVYLAEVKQKKASEANSSGVFVIEVNLSLTNSTSWVLDTGCSSHICNSLQGLRRSRCLNKGEYYLRVGNGARVAAVAVGTFCLDLPSGKTIELNNCYYVPVLIRNIISVSLLLEQGYEIKLKGNGCSISHSGESYGTGKIINGLIVLEVNDNILHVEQTNKRKRDDLNFTYLWHLRLGHINENRINKLYKDGYFDPYDYESLPICESCLKGKMTKTPFIGYGERAT
jgi:hypothetical protein